MKGHPRVIGYLQRAVSHEFSAAQQYVLQAAQAESWGMQQLAAELRQDVKEELCHAETFIRRLLALGVTPRAGELRAPGVGRSHEEMLRLGLATEAEAIRLYGEARWFCERIGDDENRQVFARILEDEEDHYQELERQLTALGVKRA